MNERGNRGISEIIVIQIDNIEKNINNKEGYKTFLFDDFILKSLGPRGYLAPVKNPIFTIFESGEWTFSYFLDHSQLKNVSQDGPKLTVFFKTHQGGGIETDRKLFLLDCHIHEKLMNGAYTASQYKEVNKISLELSGKVSDC